MYLNSINGRLTDKKRGAANWPPVFDSKRERDTDEQIAIINYRLFLLLNENINILFNYFRLMVDLVEFAYPCSVCGVGLDIHKIFVLMNREPSNNKTSTFCDHSLNKGKVYFDIFKIL